MVGQDDWHVRALGPGGSVHNFTELRKGDVILGHTMTDQRHVGYAIREFLHEPFPATLGICVPEFSYDGMLIEIEAVARNPAVS